MSISLGERRAPYRWIDPKADIVKAFCPEGGALGVSLDDDQSSHTSPGRKVRKRSLEMPVSLKASASEMTGASIDSSVSWNVP